MADRAEDHSTNWNISTLAKQLNIPVSSCHGVLNGDREPNLTHLERLCALARLQLPELLMTHLSFIPQEVLEAHVAGHQPFADLRLRGNLTPDQINRLGIAVERCAGADRIEWLLQLIEAAAESRSDSELSGEREVELRADKTVLAKLKADKKKAASKP